MLLLTAVSCDMASSLVHDDQPVARVGKENLYRSEIEGRIPGMMSPEDSAGFAERYIRLWAMDRLYADVAEKQLSKSELDVSAELESYRRSLLRYRYEQHYLNDRLDTLISDRQISDYYEAHEADFTLREPLMKIRFVDIMKDSPDLDEILALMSSDGHGDLARADSLARVSALRYFDNSGSWMSASDLARYFGTSASEMLDAMDEDIQPVAQALSNRKHELLAALERDLLDEALDSKQFVIF